MQEVKTVLLEQAFLRYCEAIVSITDDIHRDGAIQRFEYTFELVWKTLKHALASRGVFANSPKEVFRLSAREGFISDVQLWFDFLEKRNLASHVYREEYALAVQAVFECFRKETNNIIELINNLQ